MDGPLRGHVDFFVFFDDPDCVVAGGWLSRSWALAENLEVHLCGSGGTFAKTHILFYTRPDLGADGIGFIVAFPAGARRLVDVETIQLIANGTTRQIKPTARTKELPAAQAFDWLGAVLSTDGILLDGREDQRHQLLDLIRRAEHNFKARNRESAAGPVDFFGYHADAGGWFFSGWVTPGSPGPLSQVARLVTGEDASRCRAIALAFTRPDLPEGGIGVVAFVEAPRGPVAKVSALAVEVPEGLCWLRIGAATRALRESDLVTQLRPLLSALPPTESRQSLLAALDCLPYTGVDTSAALGERVHLEIDAVAVCGSAGLALAGWYLARPDEVRSIRIRCGAWSHVLDLDRCLRINRPDVIEAVGRQGGFSDSRCGFIAFLPGELPAMAPIHAEIRTTDAGTVYRNLPMPNRGGLEAMQHLLGSFDLRFQDLPPAYDNVIGPAVRGLNAQRLAVKSGPEIVDYGTPPSRPHFTVIVPLYGRIDFAEYQMAFFSAWPGNADVEFLYVLDQPERKVETERLFTSIHARFALPCRLVLLKENLGYGPANNVGLSLARGRYVVFLNSDIFPATADWLEQLAGRLEADPQLGMIGPLLLFEDESVQHRGMTFERLPEFGNWWFCSHPGKGRKFEGPAGLSRGPAITGACIMMERDLARKFNGFDEDYAIGDFEDADLCLRVAAQGRTCAVDTSVILYHLERRSQLSAAIPWRMNLTLYNAWLFCQRWDSTIQHISYDIKTDMVGGRSIA